ncbi:hypothetical protein BSG1_01365 [Bacillus sp. SG-1]|nr:hypothetical protein BSG1_01365 [Bacillus sp. SG-1]
MRKEPVYIVALGKIQKAGFFPWRQGLYSLNKLNYLFSSFLSAISG